MLAVRSQLMKNLREQKNGKISMFFATSQAKNLGTSTVAAVVVAVTLQLFSQACCYPAAFFSDW